MFAAFHGFEKKRFTLAANLAIGREWRFDIGKNAAGDGNQVALPRQLQKFIKRWRRS
jgi:hypothetical protein